MVRFLWIPLAILLCACSGSSSSPESAEDNFSASIEDQTTPVAFSSVPLQLQVLANTGNLVSEVPTIVDLRVQANSGLQIAYTESDQVAVASAEEIEFWWLHMQKCLGQTAQAPIVVVRNGSVKPFTADDDVLFHFGVPVASATAQTHNILQISVSDFDESFGDSGFYLRSIIGRLLWLRAHLQIADYPYRCASQPS
jgi:hypothetical protein